MRPMITPRAMPGAAASITFQNERRQVRMRGRAAMIAPKMPPMSEMPPCHTFSASSGEE